MEARVSLVDDTAEDASIVIERNGAQASQDGPRPAVWQVSAGPSPPGWPRTPTERPLSTPCAVGNLANGSMNNTWDLLDDPLWDSSPWKDWDLDPCQFMVASSVFQPAVSPSDDSPSTTTFQQSNLADGSNQPNQFATTSGTSFNFDERLDRSSKLVGKKKADEPFRSRGIPPGRRSDVLMRTSVNTIPGTISLGRMRHFQAPSTLESRPPALSQSAGSSMSPKDLVASASTISPQPEDQSPLRFQIKDKRHHKDTERQYRLRLNKQFSALLKALPDNVIESASGQSGRTQAEKALTKIEILALAKSHIASLEQTQAELEEESLVLRGQQELFKSLCGGDIGGS